MVIYFHEIHGHLFYCPDFHISFYFNIWYPPSSFCQYVWNQDSPALLPIFVYICGLITLSVASVVSCYQQLLPHLLGFHTNSTNPYGNWEVLWTGNFLGKLPCLIYIIFHSFKPFIYSFNQYLLSTYWRLVLLDSLSTKHLKMPPVRCLTEWA